MIGATSALIAGVLASSAAVAVDKATLALADIQVAALQSAIATKQALGGDQDAFKRLKQASDDIAQRLPLFDDPRYASDPRSARGVASLRKAAKAFGEDLQHVLAAEPPAAIAYNAGDALATGAAPLMARLDEVATVLVEGKGTPAQVRQVSRQMLLLERMQRRTKSILGGGDDAQASADGLRRDMQFFGAVLDGLVGGNANLGIKAPANPNAHEILAECSTSWHELEPTLVRVIDATPALQDAREAADRLALDGDEVIIRARDLLQRLSD